MTFFSEKQMQRIRFLHFKIKHIQEALEKEEEQVTLDAISLILEYTLILNVNYQSVNHKKILKELDISSSFHDPIENKEIEVFDLIFECARALLVMARIYSKLSENYESEKDWENAIIAMIESSKIYKTAAYFSTAAIFQDYRGQLLSPENLELTSEEARGWAQSIAATREESKNNIYFASKLYAGLSALSKRLFYLRKHDEKKKQQIRAQFHYDMGKACQLKSQASLESSITSVNKEKVKKLLQKANFYFLKAKEIWENMINLLDISKDEKENLEENITIVDEIVKENDVEVLDYELIKKIQDPEPIILIPENLAPFVPKSTIYLTKFVPKDLNIKRFKTFMGKKLEKKIPYSKREKMLDKKAGLVRTINELKILRENNEIDIDKFAELMEKYSIKLQMVDTALEKLFKK
ncbi:MAG: hypothetical protein ACTSRI_06840 [Promethearchaeota archaeon]